ncbi:hypothetical protein QBC47DRAFT_409715 [Echria macrotheca]|uniref:Nephrocystin 3-like N-terminal domain-containing protein n=1 Tax=Echria macrotheca TaxID=438768 RepID=A0AAJ0BN00_9PEZI|nr:hypothetical protein QBC47DRAFT_409715 [Echria macrotheca]
MSGLEALAIFGIACNVMQTISFACETASACKVVFETGASESHAQVLKTTESLNTALDELAKLLDPPVPASGPRPNGDVDDRALLTIARDCLAAGKQLEAEAKKMMLKTAGGKGKYAAAMLSVLKARWKKGNIEKLEKSLVDHQRVLETRLLMQIYKKHQADAKQILAATSGVDISIKAFLEALSRGHTRLEELVGNESRLIKEAIKEEAGVLGVGISDVKALVISESSKTREELGSTAADEKLLKSLKYESMNERRNQVAEAHDGTCRWIFRNLKEDEDSEEDENAEAMGSDVGGPFTEFLASPSERIFWISGKAGSGKSTLMKFLIDSDEAGMVIRTVIPDAVIISHFFWLAGQPMQRTIKGLLCSLLLAYLQQNRLGCSKILQRFPRVHSKESLSDWSNRDLEDVLFFALQDHPHGVCMFIDGLDEVDPSDGQPELLSLVQRLRGLNHDNLKLVVSSRPEPVLKKYLEQHRLLRVQDLTRPSIRKYILDKLREYNIRLDDLSSSEDSGFWGRYTPTERVVNSFLEKADGVFLWVALAVKSLTTGWSGGDSLEELQARLNALPRDLHRLYQEMWQRLNDDQQTYRKEGALFLRYTLDAIPTVPMILDPSLPESVVDGSTQPDLVLELSNGVATRVETRCAGLLEVNSDTREVSFIHRSAREFLEDTPEGRVILRCGEQQSLEQRVIRLLKAEVGTWPVRLLFEDGAVNPKYGLSRGEMRVAEASVDVMYVAHTLVHDGVLSIEGALEIMRPYRGAYEALELLRISRGPPLRAGMDRRSHGFLAMAVYDGFVELVPVEIARMSPSGKFSGAYIDYLICRAQVGSRYHSTLEKIACLLELVADTDTGPLYDIAPISVGREIITRGSIPFLKLSVSLLSRSDPTIPRCLVELLRQGGSFFGDTLVGMEIEAIDRVLNPGAERGTGHRGNTLFQVSSPHKWTKTSSARDPRLEKVILKVNATFLVELFSCICDQSQFYPDSSAADIEVLANAMKTSPNYVRASATVLTLALEEPAGALHSRDMVCVPKSRDCSDEIIAAIQNTIRLAEDPEMWISDGRGDLGYYIPGLAKLLNELESEDHHHVEMDEFLAGLAATHGFRILSDGEQYDRDITDPIPDPW